MINQFNYLDIGNLVINELVGDFWLFLGIALLLIMFFAIRANMDLKSVSALMIVFGFGMASYYAQTEILAIIGLVLSFTVYWGISKLFK